MRNISGSRSGSYPLLDKSTNQPPSSADKADGNPGRKSGRPDVVPPRPAAPSKPVASQEAPTLPSYRASTVCISQYDSATLLMS